MAKASELLNSELKVMNLGLDIFYQALLEQGVSAVHVSLSPPAKLEKRLSDALEKIL